MSTVPRTKTGINLLAVWYDTMLYKDEGFTVALEGRGEPVGDDELAEVDLQADLDVWGSGPTEQPTETLVRLTVMIEPIARPSYKAQVGVVGRFVATDEATLPLREFSSTNGVAYLVPFVRAKLAELTTHSRYGAFILPPIDVAELLAIIGERNKASEPTAHLNEPLLTQRPARQA